MLNAETPRTSSCERAQRMSHGNGARRRSGARESVSGSPRGEAPRLRLVRIKRDAVIPRAVHLFGAWKRRRPDEPEAEPLGVGHVPDALGELRVLSLPGCIRGHAGGARHA